MKFASTGGAGSGNACFYFEVRRASTGAVLGTYGSSGSPVACSAGATQGVSTTDISAQVANTTIANDLRIRVLGVETGAKAWKIESGTVTGATADRQLHLYPNTLVDSADSTPASDVWGLATAGDGATFQTQGWPTSFNTGRLVTVTFPAQSSRPAPPSPRPASSTRTGRSRPATTRAGTSRSTTAPR